MIAAADNNGHTLESHSTLSRKASRDVGPSNSHSAASTGGNRISHRWIQCLKLIVRHEMVSLCPRCREEHLQLGFSTPPLVIRTDSHHHLGGDRPYPWFDCLISERHSSCKGDASRSAVGAGDNSEIRTRHTRVWIGELRSICQTTSFCPELELHVFGNREITVHARIQVEVSRSTKEVAGTCAKRHALRLRKRSRIEIVAGQVAGCANAISCRMPVVNMDRCDQISSLGISRCIQQRAISAHCKGGTAHIAEYPVELPAAAHLVRYT